MVTTLRPPADIKRAAPVDAEEISRVILRALRETNARDYPPHVIAAVAESFSLEQVAEKLRVRNAYVAVLDGADGRVIRSVYVDPAYQGRGIGARLMEVLMGLTREEAVTTLTVPSSISAEGFYRKLGFVFVRDQHDRDERTIIMRKDIRA